MQIVCMGVSYPCVTIGLQIRNLSIHVQEFFSKVVLKVDSFVFLLGYYFEENVVVIEIIEKYDCCFSFCNVAAAKFY